MAARHRACWQRTCSEPNAGRADADSDIAGCESCSGAQGFAQQTDTASVVQMSGKLARQQAMRLGPVVSAWSCSKRARMLAPQCVESASDQLSRSLIIAWGGRTCTHGF
jgi:hypothetical protein